MPYVYIGILLLLCGAGWVITGLVAAFKRRRRVSEIESARRRLLEKCSPVVRQLADYALLNDGPLVTALRALRHSKEARDSDPEHDKDEAEPDLSYGIRASPPEMILRDLLQVLGMSDPAYSKGNKQYDSIRQYGAATSMNDVADLIDYDDWDDHFYFGRERESSLSEDVPRLVCLQILGRADHVDRCSLRELYSAFATSTSGPGTEHLPYALEEIRRAARSRSEIEEEAVARDDDQTVRWARFMGDLYALSDYHPKSVGRLAGYANRSESGLADVVEDFKDDELVIPVGLTVANVMLMDLCYIVAELCQDLPSPTVRQADLVKHFGQKTGREEFDQMDGTEITTVIKTARVELMGLQMLANIQHPDRYILRELYVGFAEDASHRCLKHLPALKAAIHTAATPAQEPPSPESGCESPSTSSSAREVLGVAEAASADEIKGAYHRHVQLWHPDRLLGMAPELQALANVRLAQVNAAYSILNERRL